MPGHIVEYVAQALKQTSREATILLYAPAQDPHLQKDDGPGRPDVLHLRGAGSSGERASEGGGEDGGSAGYAGGILMRWPWRRGARQIEPKLTADLKVVELQTAKEILAEVFHARPGEAEVMIQSRLQ